MRGCHYKLKLEHLKPNIIRLLFFFKVYLISNEVISEPNYSRWLLIYLIPYLINKYENWSIKLKILLRSQGIWKRRGTMNPKMKLHSWRPKRILWDMRKRDNKALFLIYQGLDEKEFEKVDITTNSNFNQAWEILQNSYKRIENVWLQPLRDKFEVLKMEAESISNYFIRVLIIVSQWRRKDETL